jgi:hypothetical protein
MWDSCRQISLAPRALASATLVSPGCGGGEHGAPCYAKTMMDTRYRKVQWGPHGDRLRTSEANWKQPPRWAKTARGSGERPRVFCASLADWLDNKAPQEGRVDLAALIAATPELENSQTSTPKMRSSVAVFSVH